MDNGGFEKDGKKERIQLSANGVNSTNGVNGVYRQLDVTDHVPQTVVKVDQPANGNGHTGTSSPSEEDPPPVKKVAERRVGFFELFHFADRVDIALMLIGTFCAMVVGAASPFTIYILGNVITLFIENEQSIGLEKTFNRSAMEAIIASNDTTYKCYIVELKRLLEKMPSVNDVSSTIGAPTSKTPLYDVVVSQYLPIFCGVAICVFIFGYLSMSSWVLTAERQVRKVRMAFFKSVMKQDIGWFDTHESGELNTRMSDDLDRLHDGFGDKMATFIQWITTFIGGYVLGLVKGWELALIMMCTAPLLAIAAGVMGRIIRTFVQKELKAYAKAGSVATEALIAIRTVTAFGGQEKVANRYHGNLKVACRQGIKKGILSGTTAGIIWILVFSSFALAFWYGAMMVRERCLDSGMILQVFFGIFMGSLSLGNAAPVLENFANARGAAAALFEVIEMPSKIDSSSDEGLKPASLKGDIEFSGIHFSYPARPEVTIMKNMNLKIAAGQTVALVGQSGCGKSTTIQLLQRFYDPLEGNVKLDGINVTDLNICWLRSHIGIVGQEPVLFSTTIGDNIRLGGTNVKDEDIVRAAKEANCYDFIMNLPDKFDTMVGERGAQLSGGQKQRIAIARALVSNPRILLLDEATSALDTESEAIVQAALDKASLGRTTIIIAHRLSTVRNANVIFALSNGSVAEQGTHNELMKKQGVYYTLNTMQATQPEKKQALKDDDMSDDEYEEEIKQSGIRHRTTSILSALSDGASEEVGVFERSRARRSSRVSAVASQRRSTFKRGNAPYHSIDEKDTSNPLRASIRSIRDGVRAAAGKSTDLDIDIDIGNADANQELSRKEKEKAALAIAESVPIRRIYKLNMPEIKFIVMGCIGAAVAGAIQPSFAILMSQVIGVLGVTLDPKQQEEEVTFWCLIMVAVGLASACAIITQQSMFGLSGERLTERLRLQSFKTMLNQEMGWFDEQKNQVGILTARLAMDASQVKGATGGRASIMMQSLSSVITALVIGFVFSWELTVVVMYFMPLSILGGVVQGKLLRGFAQGDNDAIEEGGKMAQEAISNIRTVVSLNKEKHFVDKFHAHFKQLFKRDRIKSMLYGVAFGGAQSVIFWGYAVTYTYGSYLVDTTRDSPRPVQFFYVMRVFSAITFGGIAVGRAASAAPDYTKAKVAAANILRLFDRKSKISSSDTSGHRIETCQGNIDFTDVAFRYPARPTVPILTGLTVSVKPGERLALVGASGCGKSTTVSLLERFYDPLEGSVTLDGKELRTLNIEDLRQNIGIVSQEPILFDASIAENIAYGDNQRVVGMDEIMAAAAKANIHTFISSLPSGYNTNVGDKGTQLSGGQKQRIAIARALLRNPQILLLDEATSALDTESEKVVQEALERAQEGRTCIIIAHRLSTIKNANKIAVIHKGQVAEIGTHSELLARKKFYYKLVNAQL